jgi:hypothetical protein
MTAAAKAWPKTRWAAVVGWLASQNSQVSGLQLSLTTGWPASITVQRSVTLVKP